MKKIAVILADGCEETEAISIIDVARRANIEVCVVGLHKKNITTQGKIRLITDEIFDDVNFDDFDAIVLPGGLEGTNNLANDERVLKILQNFNSKNRLIAAICAAPFVLKKAEILKNSYTCYPGFETKISHKGYKNDKNIIFDENILTSRGPATAMEFGLEIVKILLGEKSYKDVKNGLLWQ